ncbi:MAG: bifunctional phosphoserine phosphatase/homoserine phosphotransferase ThrH [Fibrobacterales bacterium]
MATQKIIALDLEGVLIPEVWIEFANKTGIEALKLTTRDIPDYDELMQGRLDILKENNFKLSQIQDVISTLEPLKGAKEFLAELRSITQVIILSDTFVEFAVPFMKQLDWPTIFCHNLTVENDVIVDYCLRQPDQKKKAVQALTGLNYSICAAGDSFNDTTMLKEAELGILFKSNKAIQDQFPELPAVEEYPDLMNLIKDFLKQ